MRILRKKDSRVFYENRAVFFLVALFVFLEDCSRLVGEGFGGLDEVLGCSAVVARSITILIDF